MFVQCYEPWGGHFTNFHYHYYYLFQCWVGGLLAHLLRVSDGDLPVPPHAHPPVPPLVSEMFQFVVLKCYAFRSASMLGWYMAPCERKNETS